MKQVTTSICSTVLRVMNYSRPVLVVAALGVALAGITGCGSEPAAPLAPVTVTVTASPMPEPTLAPAPTPTAAPVTQVVIPDVEGMNGALALEQLERAGLTNVQPASQDEEDKVVLYAANWTVTSVEPGPGTEVASDSTVIVTMTKQ